MQQLGKLIRKGTETHLLQWSLTASSFCAGFIALREGREFLFIRLKKTYFFALKAIKEELSKMFKLQEVKDALLCLIYMKLLQTLSGLRTSVSVTWQRTCCLATTHCFLFSIGSNRTRVERLESLDRRGRCCMMSVVTEAVNKYWSVKMKCLCENY